MTPSGGGTAAFLVAALLWAGCVAGLLLRAVRQMRRYPVIPVAFAARLPGAAPRLCVIVPVRDEARVIERCLAGLQRQDYPTDRLALTVVDDNSRDGSAEIMQRMAGGRHHLRLIRGRELPGGWAGKPFACWQGALASSEAEWLCFIDADTVSEPGLLRHAVALAEAGGLAFLSLEPFQELGTFWDRLIIPTGLFAVACSQDLRRTTDPACADAAVNGQFLLIRRDAYFAVGGHAAVRGEICEDSALARRVKQAGYRIGVFGAERLIRTRMYGGLRDLWEGLSKNVTETFGGAPATLGIGLAALVVGWATPLLPLWIAVAAPAQATAARAAFGLAAAASLAMLATQIGVARHFRIPWRYGLLFPLACSAAALLAVNAVIARARGRVAWKGRIYKLPNKPRRARS